MPEEPASGPDPHPNPPAERGSPPDRVGRTGDGAGDVPPAGPRISGRRLLLAFAVAGLSDAVCFFAAPVPPVVWAVDLATAAALFAVLGWRWLLLPGLVTEAIPGFGVLPVWLLVVAAIAIWGTARPKWRSLRPGGG